MLVRTTYAERDRERVYAQFRRTLEEKYGIYHLEQFQHHCWTNNKEDLKEVWLARTNERFFGCYICGRSHWCRLPDLDTCPRAPGSTPGEYVCPYSGIPLDAYETRSSTVGSFKQQNMTFDQIREARKRTTRDESYLTGSKIGRTVARSLVYQRKFSQAADALSGVQNRHAMRVWDRQIKDHTEFQQHNGTTVDIEDRRMPWQKNAEERGDIMLPEHRGTTSDTVDALWDDVPDDNNNNNDDDEEMIDVLHEEHLLDTEANRMEEDVYGENHITTVPASLDSMMDIDDMDIDARKRTTTTRANKTQGNKLKHRTRRTTHDEDNNTVPMSKHDHREEQMDVLDDELDDNYDDYYDNEDGGGDDDDNNGTRNGQLGYAPVRAPEWSNQALVIPQVEARYDMAYLSHWLQPLETYLQCQHTNTTWASVFKPPQSVMPPTTTTPSTRVKKLPSPSQSSPSSLSENLWPMMRRDMPFTSYLTHQHEMLRYVREFIAHFSPLLIATQKKKTKGRKPKTTTTTETNVMDALPIPMPDHEYVRMCDTLLLVYMTFHPNPSPIFFPDQPARITRMMFVMLTHVFTSPFYQRNPITNTRIPIWLGDAWLDACRSNYLFQSLQTTPATLVPSGASNISIGFNSSAIGMELTASLSHTPYSPHALYHLFHPPQCLPQHK